MAFTQTAKQVGASINKIDAKKLRADIQTAALHVIGHAMEHGSSPLVEALTDRMALVPMLKKLAPMVSAFLIAQGPFVHAKDTGWQFSKAKKAKLIESGYDFDTFAEEAPMWDDQESATKKAVAFDLFKEVGKLVARAEKKSIAGECIGADMIEVLKAAMGHYAGAKVVGAASEASKAAAVDFAAQIKAVEAELAAA